MAPPPCFKPKSQWEAPKGPPETQTVYQLSFLQNDIGCRPDLIKPNSNFKLYDDDYFDLNTVYRNSFQSNQMGERASPIVHKSTLSSSKARPESSTVYKLSYFQQDGENARQAPIRPVSNLNWKSNEPLETLTTQKATYIQQPLCRSEPIKHRENNIIFGRSMDYNHPGTVYNLSYVPLPTERVRPIRPVNQYIKPNDPVDTHTTYKLSYVRNSTDERPFPIRPTSDFSLFGNENYNVGSIYKNSYQNVGQIDRPCPIRHKTNLGSSKERPVSDTVYKLSYVPNQVYERSVPIRHEGNIGSSAEEPFHGISTQKQDFIPLPYCRAEPIIHRESHIRLKGPVEKGTVYKLSYMPVKSEVRTPFRPVNQYEKPKGRVETGTTYKMSFLENNQSWARPEMIRPCSDFKLFNDENGNFTDFNTIYKNSYHPIAAKRSAPIRHRDNLTVSGGQTECNTVYKLSYVPNQYGFERSQPIRPAENEWKIDAPFEGNTTTKQDFTPHELTRTAPIRHKDNQIQWGGRMDKRTVYSMSYMPVRAERAEPIIPKQQYERSVEPFECGTTYNNTFVQHDTPVRTHMPWIRRNTWERPTAPMETMTVQKLSYQAPCMVQV